MAARLSAGVLRFLSDRLDKTPAKIRPRLSEIRREHGGLTPNAAAQLYAQKQGTSIMAKLDPEDRQSLASVQAMTQVNTSKIVKIDRRTLHITNSPIHNLSFGDGSNLSQTVVALDSSLTELFEKIEKTSGLSSKEKNDYKSDVQSLASQIGKSKPSRQIIKAAWKSIQGLADVEGFAQLVVKITPLIQSFFS